MTKYQALPEQRAEKGREKYTSLDELYAGFQPSKGSLEEELYGKKHAQWAALKTFEAILPFGKILGLTESGGKEFGMMDFKDKALYTGLSTVEVIPLAWGAKAVTIPVGKGFKTLRKLVKGSGEKVTAGAIKHPKRLLEQMGDELYTKLKPFVDKTEDDVLLRKYMLRPDEARAVKEGWESAFAQIHTPSEGMKKVLGADGKVRKNVAAELSRARRPAEEKMLEHYRREFKRTVSNVMGPKFVAKKNQEKTFQALSKEIYGEKIGKDLLLESADPDMFADIALRLLDDPGKFKALGGLGRGLMFVKLTPVRFVFGKTDPFFGTIKNVYEKGKKAKMSANEYGFFQVQRFSAALADKGLGKIKHLTGGEFRFKLHKHFRDDFYAAGKAMKEMDDLVGSGAGEDALRAVYMRQTDGTRKFMDVFREWADELYFDDFRHHVQLLVKDKNIPAFVQGDLARLLEEGADAVIPQMRRLFRGSSDVSHFAKATAVKAEIGRLASRVEALGAQGVLPKEAGEKLLRGLGWKSKKNPEGIVNYLDSYVPRISEAREVTRGEIARGLMPGRMSAFYTKDRTRAVADATSDHIGRWVEARAMAQANERFLYPAFKEIGEFAKRLPREHREFTGHWLFRQLGQPSPVDTAVAEWIGRTYGRLEKFLGGSGVWNERRVLDLTYNINNLVYLGGLGFKPFAGARNLFQTLNNVPGDLGGAKDFGYLVKGIHRASKPEFRKFCRDDLKIIQEFAPELHLRAQAVPGFRTSVMGKTLDLPGLTQVRDTGMWLFKGSDRWNRYSTAGAAITKWENHARRLIKDGIVDPSFINKMNLKGRNPWVRKELEELLIEGGSANIEKARNIFIRDVVADTQYLYGVSDAAIASQAWGAPAKAAMVFQTWWMNYAKLLGKWITTGDAGTKANRMFTFMLSAALAEQLMEPIWGRGTAMRTVGFGPFPGEFNEFMIPPTFAPAYHFLAGTINLGKGDLDTVNRHAKQFARSGLMFVPGGLQIGQTYRGWKEEGFEGLAPSIVRYSRDQDYAPLFGLFE